MIHRRFLLPVLLVSIAIGSAAHAQGCAGTDDGFDTAGGCCTPFITPTLPTFPSVTMNADWAELRKCGPTSQQTVAVTLTAPTMVLCDYATLQVIVAFPGGETITGLLAAKYVRTFLDLTTPASQVWRFLVNGDLTCSPLATSTPCTTPLPRCSFVPGQSVHFDGHIDYQCIPGTVLGSVSFSLSHHSGCLSHAPWSCVPMTGVLAHSESSYHLVGPAPFVFAAPSPIPNAPMVSDATRTSFLTFVPALTYVCLSEQKVGPIGTVVGTAAGCASAACNLAVGCSTGPCTTANPSCYEDVALNFSTCCNGAIWAPHVTVPIAGTPIQATGMFGIRLGSWGALPQYPANVDLRVYFGAIQGPQAAGCPPINSPINAAVGVATGNMAGQPYTLNPTCLPAAGACHTFMDLANVLPLNNLPALNPGYGCLAASDIVWSFNLP
jgi:hypothetical protein